MKDAMNARNAGDGDTLAQMGTVTWHRQDYAWTHSTPVEGLFLVLTIAIVPVAVFRWMRRLRSLPIHANRQWRRDLEI